MLKLTGIYFLLMSNQLSTVLSAFNPGIDKIINFYKDRFVALVSLFYNQSNSYNNKKNNVIPFEKAEKGSSLIVQSCDKAFKVIVTVLLILACVGTLRTDYVIAKPVKVYVDVKVNNGDTVWSVASKYASNTEDMRDLIDHIRSINGLNQNAQINAGQILKIPVSAEL